MDWLEYMQREQRLFDSQARMFTELPSNVAAMEGIAGAINKDKDRPAYWIPKEVNLTFPTDCFRVSLFLAHNIHLCSMANPLHYTNSCLLCWSAMPCHYVGECILL